MESWEPAGAAEGAAACREQGDEPLAEPVRPATAAGDPREFDRAADLVGAAQEVRAPRARRLVEAVAEPGAVAAAPEHELRQGGQAKPAWKERQDGVKVRRRLGSGAQPTAGATAQRAVSVLQPERQARRAQPLMEPQERPAPPVQQAWPEQAPRLDPAMGASLELPVQTRVLPPQPVPAQQERQGEQEVRLLAERIFQVRSGRAAASTGDDPRAAA